MEKNIVSTDANPWRYCGEYYDKETDTIYLRARYYSPKTGRFTQQDTYRGDPSDPLSLNLYTYCMNNPLQYTDPTGHSPWKNIGEFFHGVKNDAKGRDILWHWLYGEGKELKFNNDKSWNKYMMSNERLTNNVADLVIGYASEVKNGKSKSFNITTFMEIENGEQMIGYQYLHGTNADVGGFNIIGTITKDAKGNATISFEYQWNDKIDPNFKYNTDIKKAEFAKSIPFADPTDYTIRIGWSDVSVLDSDGNFISGWLQSSTYSVTSSTIIYGSSRG